MQIHEALIESYYSMLGLNSVMLLNYSINWASRERLIGSTMRGFMLRSTSLKGVGQ
jgi:hypothetical protein